MEKVSGFCSPVMFYAKQFKVHSLSRFVNIGKVAINFK